MDTISLKTQTRELSEKAADLRREDILPIECYGKDKENLHLKVNYQDFRRVYLKAGGSTILDLEVEGGEGVKAIVQDVQYDPVSGKILHVDLEALNMKEKMTTHVPLVTEGEAPAIEAYEGVLIQNKDEVMVKCLPNDLIHEIKVDISGLAELHDTITVADLKVPDNIEILDEPELNVITVSPPKEEEPEPAEGEETEGEEGEGEEGEGTEEAKEGEEGEEKKEENSNEEKE